LRFNVAHFKVAQRARMRQRDDSTALRSALRQAELEWTRRLAEDIRTGALEGIDLWRSFHHERGG